MTNYRTVLEEYTLAYLITTCMSTR